MVRMSPKVVLVLDWPFDFHHDVPSETNITSVCMFTEISYSRLNCVRKNCHPAQAWLRSLGRGLLSRLFSVEVDFVPAGLFLLGRRLGLMWPVCQSKSWWQSSVGTIHVFTGGSIPNWLNRDRVSGILISEMYLRNRFQEKSQDVSS